MPRYSRETVTEVASSNDIVEVIGAVLELKPAGASRFKALCPFHAEKTPSFSVDRNRQQFYCFGCEKGGDVIAFVQEFEGLTFTEALQKLADRGGVQLPAPSAHDKRGDYLRLRLRDLGAFARKLYSDTLNDPLKGGKGRAYLSTRSLTADTVKRFGLGYAPDSWSTLLDAAKAAGFKETELEASGMVKRGDRGNLYDLFRNRLTIPIRDVSGNIVAFGGRDLSGEAPAKYINSPESAVYKKSRVLYGLYEAKEGMRREKKAVLVEGYFDALRCFDAGIDYAVAPCGTALTREQGTLLHRYVSEVIVVFDGDVAGIRAAVRGVGILTAAGLTVRAMVLPEGLDPDDFIRENGADAFRRRMETAPDFVTFYIEANEPRTGSIEGRTDLARELFGMLAHIDDELRRDEYLKRMARGLDLNEWTCRSEFSRFLRREAARSVSRAPKTVPKKAVHDDDCAFIAVLLNNEPLLERARDALGAEAPVSGPVGEILRAIFASGQQDAAHGLESEEARTLYAAAVNRDPMNTDSDAANALVEKYLNGLKRSWLRQERARIQEAILDVERSGDTEKLAQLLAQRRQVDLEAEKVGAA